VGRRRYSLKPSQKLAEPAPIHNEGSRRFTPFVLLIYDLFVLRFSTSRIWRCPTKKFLLPLFRENFSERHLEIGAGNGFFPTTALTAIKKSQAGALRKQHVTFVDLSQHSLNVSKQRVLSRHPEADIQCVVADAVKPMPASLQSGPFDSAALYLVLQFVHGSSDDKAQAFRIAKQHLSDEGVLFGAVVLGKVWEKRESGYVNTEKRPSWLTSFALEFYNKRGIFANLEDDPGVLDAVLRQEFEEVESRIVGMVFLFSAKRPRRV
jgi:ubiquinone/menaquinone biosynthesis C-methylase UbiE